MAKINFSTIIIPVAKAKGLSFSRLARKVDVGEKHLYSIASGRHAPRVTLAMQIANELGLTVNELFFLWPNGDQPIETLKKAS